MVLEFNEAITKGGPRQPHASYTPKVRKLSLYMSFIRVRAQIRQVEGCHAKVKVYQHNNNVPSLDERNSMKA